MMIMFVVYTILFGLSVAPYSVYTMMYFCLYNIEVMIVDYSLNPSLALSEGSCNRIYDFAVIVTALMPEI